MVAGTEKTGAGGATAPEMAGVRTFTGVKKKIGQQVQWTCNTEKLFS
jgi:hypothetical protein